MYLELEIGSLSPPVSCLVFHFMLDTTRGCLEDRLLEFQDAVDKGNAFVHLDQETDASKQNVIYVGKCFLFFWLLSPD